MLNNILLTTLNSGCSKTLFNTVFNSSELVVHFLLCTWNPITLDMKLLKLDLSHLKTNRVICLIF